MKGRPVVLLSAYGCEPHKGSEGGVGWNWALQLAKGSEVHVVTREARRPAVEAFLNEHGLDNPEIYLCRVASVDVEVQRN